MFTVCLCVHLKQWESLLVPVDLFHHSQTFTPRLRTSEENLQSSNIKDGPNTGAGSILPTHSILKARNRNHNKKIKKKTWHVANTHTHTPTAAWLADLIITKQCFSCPPSIFKCVLFPPEIKTASLLSPPLRLSCHLHLQLHLSPLSPH